MDEGNGAHSGDEADKWAQTTVRSLALAGTVSTMLFIGAGLALLLGVVGAVTTYSSMTSGTDFGDMTSMSSPGWRMAVSQTLAFLLGCLLPAGLLAAAAVALRLQAARFEAGLEED